MGNILQIISKKLQNFGCHIKTKPWKNMLTKFPKLLRISEQWKDKQYRAQILPRKRGNS